MRNGGAADPGCILIHTIALGSNNEGKPAGAVEICGSPDGHVVECYEMLRYLYSNVPGVTNCHYYATAATAIVTGTNAGGLRSLRTASIVRFAVS
jgi:hypothetical protein